jgi:hypothetical protein
MNNIKFHGVDEEGFYKLSHPNVIGFFYMKIDGDMILSKTGKFSNIDIRVALKIIKYPMEYTEWFADGVKYVFCNKQLYTNYKGNL